MAKINCAVYVRKSTEKGLELEFNSLHNQEEACRNYILSQSFNNWEYYKTYTDGGISGGTMERPALKQMLEDMSKGLIQTVVVYKVDRLSRSIMDFHNMMKEFEKCNCNFVSITQAFDTSTSMGKLTLNMLLSFAQFEREVSSERVRDKIQASKAKGLWTGGTPKLGYDLKDKKLIVNEKEAVQVQQIFESYLECGSLLDLEEKVFKAGIRNKAWITSKGENRGGNKMTVAMVHRILNERVYIGDIENKRFKQSFKGQHNAIVSKELWDKVHEKLKNQNSRCTSRWTKNNNLLSGKLFNACGKVFTNQATVKKGTAKRRYYAVKGFYIPMEQADKLTVEVVQEILNADLSGLGKAETLTLKQINFETLGFQSQRDFIRAFIEKIIYTDGKMTFFLKTDAEVLKTFTDGGFLNQNKENLEFIADRAGNQIIIEKPVLINKGHSTNTYNAGKVGLMTVNDNNRLVVRAFAYAWKYKKMYEGGLSTDNIAAKEKASLRTIYKYLNLAYLSPRIINTLMDGTKTIDIQKLFEIASKYEKFDEQEKALAC